jgi:hypothetical protein
MARFLAPPGGLRRALAAAATALWILPAAAAPRAAASAELPEYSVKAAFLYHFAQFVEWPSDTAGAPSTLTIGVLGDDPFGDQLDRVALGKTVGGRTLSVRRLAAPEEAARCDILFISTSEAGRLSEILARLGGAPVLTVGEADRFARRGGMIGFFFEDGRVRLEVNVKAAEAARLRVSSKLLSVARLVKQGSEGGR